MARALGELFPRRFEDLTLSDVAAIVASVGEQRESLFFERKAEVSPRSLAKACAAFANTLGGLLLVGIADEDDALVGIEPRASEAQLWVKDTLRGNVLPMPPFRARWLETSGGRGLLLVLVEESSSTPHLLTSSGAIYVRNPGSSDPVPLSDQRRLLDLTSRGREAERDAERRAEAAANEPLFDAETAPPVEVLAVAATGVTAAFEERVLSSATPEAISVQMWGGELVPNREYRRAHWSASFVGVARHVRPGDPFASTILEGAAVARSGIAWWYRSVVEREGQEWPDLLEISDSRAIFEMRLASLRAILAELGAHGRLRLVYVFRPGDRRVQFAPSEFRDSPDCGVRRWTTFDDGDIVDDVFAEIRRAAGLPPPRETAQT